EKKTTSKGEIARAGVDLGMTVVNTIKDSISTARNLLFTFENAWNVGLSETLPVLNIAMKGLKIIISSWDVIKADKHRQKMRQEKQKVKVKLGHSKTNKLDNKKIAKLKALNPSAQTQKDIEQYELAKELQTINAKRINRQILHITTALTSITGDLFTLTGYGAVAGTGFKLAASGTELGAQGIRTMQQWGRNRANKKNAWRITQKVFDKDKNTKAKLAKREAFANMIYDQIVDLDARSSTYQNGIVPYKDPDFKRIRDYIRATGMSWKAWLNVTMRDADKGHAAIMAGLAKRE
ncbi:MAG: hypothetical protein AAFY76_16735, partial [Cyanobacteria bacterium J06649_11]